VLETDPDDHGLIEAINAEPWAVSVEREAEGGISVTVVDGEAAARRIPRMIADRGLALRRFESGEVALEEVFVDLVASGQGERA